MRIFLAMALVFALSALCVGQGSAVSYESITITNVATGITPATLNLVLANGSCSGRLEDAQVRFRIDGTDPTAAEGILLEIGDTITITKLGNLLAFSAIRTGLVSGTLNIHCFQ